MKSSIFCTAMVLMFLAWPGYGQQKGRSLDILEVKDTQGSR
jgi:hypothetical protein